MVKKAKKAARAPGRPSGTVSQDQIIAAFVRCHTELVKLEERILGFAMRSNSE